LVSQAVILAGGKGERLASRLGGRPKPLVEIAGLPLLERQLRALEAAGFSETIVLASHLAEQLTRFLDARSPGSLKVTVVEDGVLTGTAGAVINVREMLHDDFLVIYGDTLFDVDLARLCAFHQRDRQAAATLLVHPNDHPWDSDLVEIDETELIRRFHRPPHPQGDWLANRVSAALYVVRKDSLTAVRPSDGARSLDFAHDVFPALLEAGASLRAYESSEYIKDIGAPERLDRACEDLVLGKVAGAALRNRQRAVFLDRDGVLNALNGHIASPDQLEVFATAGEAVRMINRSGYRAVVVTNQPVVARGECTLEDLGAIHAKLETVLGRASAFVDRIYVCPHHPDAGFPGEVVALKRRCDCRKPAPGLLLRAQADFNIDFAQSWMIGDRAADRSAARACGVGFVLVSAQDAPRADDPEALNDFVFGDVRRAALFITAIYPEIARILAPVIDGAQAPGELFIGGPAGSGKTTAAAVLARELRQRGRQTTIVSLDRAPARNGGRDIGEALLTYHRERRRLAGASPETIRIWEGSAALAVARVVRAKGERVLLETVRVTGREAEPGGADDRTPDADLGGSPMPWMLSLDAGFEPQRRR